MSRNTAAGRIPAARAHRRRGNVDALPPFVWTLRQVSGPRPAVTAQGSRERSPRRCCLRRGNESRASAERVRSVLSDEVRLWRTDSHPVCWLRNRSAPRRPNAGTSPHTPPRRRLRHDQGVQEPGHHGPRHAWLDATKRAGGRVIADDDEQCVGCQISNALERESQRSAPRRRSRPPRPPTRRSISALATAVSTATTSNPLVPSRGIHVPLPARPAVITRSRPLRAASTRRPEPVARRNVRGSTCSLAPWWTIVDHFDSETH